MIAARWLLPLVLVTSLAGGAAHAQQKPTTTADTTKQDAESERAQQKGTGEAKPPLVYTPPRRGRPTARVGGGARGFRPLPSLVALVPEHVAHTTSASPTLFWYLDALPPESAVLLFALTRDELTDPVAEIDLPRARTPGIQRLALADHGVEIEPGVEYRWAVSLMRDREAGSDAQVAIGWVERVPAPANLVDRTARHLAEAGLWYDALAAAQQAVDEKPEDAAAREARDSLLEQVDLHLPSP